MNMHSIREPQRQQELIYNMKTYNISIMGIQEHRIVHSTSDQPLKFLQIGDHYLLMSSSWQNSQQAAVGGVGIVMSPLARKLLMKIKALSNQVLMASFKGNPIATVISAYSPISLAAEEEMESSWPLREARCSTCKSASSLGAKAWPGLERRTASHIYRCS